MNHANGLDILVDAFIILKKKSGFEDVRLLLTGGYTGDDARYIKNLMRKIKASGLASVVQIHDDFDGPGRSEFFDRVSVMSVPLREGYAFGLFILEAMASGIPVVQPEAGAFPEIINATQGGVLYRGNTPETLAESLAALLNDPEKMNAMSLNARKGVEEKFNIFDTSAKMMKIFENARKS
jgi:glycosyltransferase involved in cell wall biosynthesis